MWIFERGLGQKKRREEDKGEERKNSGTGETPVPPSLEAARDGGRDARPTFRKSPGACA